MGHFIKRGDRSAVPVYNPPHVCNPPLVHDWLFPSLAWISRTINQLGPGAIWECSCGQQLELVCFLREKNRNWRWRRTYGKENSK